ncbi:MAG TPA: CRTAC1 family protein, partial [Terriglobales bacterium]
REPGVLSINQGDGTFCDASKLAGPAIQQNRVLRGLAAGDLFNDGNIDLVVEDLDGLPMILRNEGAPENHWISFELQGTKSNRLAIGAKLKIQAGRLVQTSEIHSGGSYLSQHDLRVHFGLGPTTKVDSVEVQWPSGAVDRIPGSELAADKFYYVLEGKGLVRADQVRPKKLSQ